MDDLIKEMEQIVYSGKLKLNKYYDMPNDQQEEIHQTWNQYSDLKEFDGL
jgi:hypothetical protein